MYVLFCCHLHRLHPGFSDIATLQKLQLSTVTLQLQCLGHQDWALGQNTGYAYLCYVIGGGEQ